MSQQTWHQKSMSGVGGGIKGPKKYHRVLPGWNWKQLSSAHPLPSSSRPQMMPQGRERSPLSPDAPQSGLGASGLQFVALGTGLILTSGIPSPWVTGHAASVAYGHQLLAEPAIDL
jgi:hypothetical protein